MSADSDRVFDRYLRAFLSVVITVGFFGVIVGLFFVQEIPSSTKDILLVMLGALLASYKEITGYAFGSSSGSTSKGSDQAASLAIKDAALIASSVAKDTALMAAVEANTDTDAGTPEMSRERRAPEMSRERRATDPKGDGVESVTIPTTTTIITKEDT